MRKLLVASSLALCLAAPASARAMGLELSLGKGATVSPDTKAQPLNLMAAPGISFVVVRLQLGLVADLPDVQNSKFDIGLRPMLTISPPILPLYGRVVFAVNNMIHGDRRSFTYGGALGLSFGLAGVGVFAEAGLLPRVKSGVTAWVIEGRLGLSLGF
ncbi:MAG TPA: hypothetical protein VN914_06910 [Polyangia bacterium]|nr:hypothetical protein [Polyangia bacterium]